MEESERKENEYIKTLYTYILSIGLCITQKGIHNVFGNQKYREFSYCISSVVLYYMHKINNITLALTVYFLIK